MQLVTHTHEVEEMVRLLHYCGEKGLKAFESGGLAHQYHAELKEQFGLDFAEATAYEAIEVYFEQREGMWKAELATYRRRREEARRGRK